MKNALNILIKAKDIVEKGWCKNSLFRDANGKAIRSTEYTDGCHVCAIGAMKIAALNINFQSGEYSKALKALGKETPMWPEDYQLRGMQMPIDSFNDQSTTTKQDILNLYDRAIAKLQAQLTEESAPVQS